jgi:hypothetical protein
VSIPAKPRRKAYSRNNALTRNPHYSGHRTQSGYLVQLQRRYSRVPIEQLQSSILHQIKCIWDGKRNGRAYPERNDLRPHDFAPFLRHLSLARVIEEGNDFEIRIVGDEIVQAYGENVSGRMLSSLSDLVGEAMVDAYLSVTNEGEPILLQGFFERTRNHTFRREVILLPLGSDGRVNFVLSAGMLMPRDSGRNRSLEGEAA